VEKFAQFASTGTPVKTAVRLPLFELRRLNTESDKRAAFDEIQKNLIRSGNPAEDIAILGQTLEGISDTDQELTDNLGATAVAQNQYLLQHLSQAPTDIMGNPAFDISVTEIESFFERYGALQSPEALMFAMAEGTLTEEAVDAVRTVYPNLFSFMQSEVAAAFGDLSEKGQKVIPYSAKVSASYLLGPGVDPSLSHQFVMSMQSPAAQTAMQSKAISGPRPSSRQPSFSSNAMTVTARLEKL
jgi:hypothetical protein